MMRAVQHAAPENPDALALDVEEPHALQPPSLRFHRKLPQARRSKTEHASHEAVNRVGRRKCLGRGRLGQAQKLAEKAPLAQDVMTEYLADRARLLVRPPIQVCVGETAPHGSGLVRLALVGVENVLKNGLCCRRDVQSKTLSQELAPLPSGA